MAKTTSRLFLTLAACAFLIACGGEASTPTQPASPGYAGEWSGNTFQGRPISFTVSPDQKVTAISVGYAFSGCSGVETFTNLDKPISSSPPVAGHGATLPDGRGISIQIFFLSDRLATVGLIFYGPPDCGSTGTSGPSPFISKR